MNYIVTVSFVDHRQQRFNYTVLQDALDSAGKWARQAKVHKAEVSVILATYQHTV